MKSIFLLFAPVLLISCDTAKTPLPQAPLVQPKVSFEEGKPPLSISVVNKQKTDPLDISDQIIFSGFLESGLFSPERLQVPRGSYRSQGLKMKVSSRCSFNGEKLIFDQEFSQYRFTFSVIELLPEPLFLKMEQDRAFCSFLFMVRDQNLGEHHFSLTQLPLSSVLKRKHLILKNQENKDLKDFLNKVIRLEDANEFFLVHDRLESIGKVRFICKDWIQKTGFKVNYGITPVFRALASLEESMPHREQECRLVSEDQNKVSGITAGFKIDFSSFQNQLSHLNLNQLQLKLHNHPLGYTIGNEGAWAFYPHLDAERKEWDWQRAGRSPTNRSTTLYSKQDYSPAKKYEGGTFLFGYFSFENLPKDFSEKRYKPAWIQVDTECEGGLFPQIVRKESYGFPFTPTFSLMSVTPEELFQVYYGLEGADTETLKRVQRTSSRCSYRIILKDSHDQINYPEIYRDIFWNPGGFGADFDSGLLKRGFPISSRDIEWENLGSLHFTFKRELSQYDESIQVDHQPNHLRFVCGYLREEGVHEILRLNIESPAFSIPLHLLLTAPSFKKSLEANPLLQCRILFYKDENVKYFSPVIKIMDVTFKEDLKRLPAWLKKFRQLNHSNDFLLHIRRMREFLFWF